MGKLTVTTFVSLDGVMQAPGGSGEDDSGGFRHGGWVMPHFDEKLGAFITSIFERADAFLLGRGTYDVFADHWPKVTSDDPVATGLNTRPKHVVSRTLASVDWNASELVRDVRTEVPALKAKYAGELQVHGSAGLVQSLLARGLVDEINLITFPVVLGQGKRLFGDGVAPLRLAMIDSATTETGVVIGRYGAAGAVTYANAPAPE